MKYVIFTADDFGASESVNEAVEQGSSRGILTAASLMVGAPAAADAVRRAGNLPHLRVGLHLVLVRGRPVLPPAEVPDLVDANGAFIENLFHAGVRFFFRPRARRQLAAEIRAQFAAFAATGLSLDHVNAHNHMQLHPTVLNLILSIGRDFGLRAVRVPFEPAFGNNGAGNKGMDLFLRPWVALMKRRLRGAGVGFNDYVFGINDSGRLDETRLLQLLPRCPTGVSEIYFHPAAPRSAVGGAVAPGYDGVAELNAIVSPRVAESVRLFGLRRVGFSDLFEQGPPASMHS